MPTATLTWSENHGDSNPQSTFGATTQGAIQLLNQYFTTLAAQADFPWQVCSHEGTTAPWFVTLKRKTGAAGRIIFIGVNTAPISTYNPQLGTMTWNVAGMRVAYFPDATSDTPANILSLTGDVFTNPTKSTGLGMNYSSFSTGTNTFTAWACEDGVFLRYGPVASLAAYFIVGALVEDASQNAAGITFSTAGAMDNVAVQTTLSIANPGGYQIFSGSPIHFGTGWAITTSPAPYLRDNGLKKAWFLPRSLACFGLPPDYIFTYKFRQIAHGPVPLAGYERLATVGNVLAAQSAYPAATAGYPWLLNFKV